LPVIRDPTAGHNLARKEKNHRSHKETGILDKEGRLFSGKKTAKPLIHTSLRVVRFNLAEIRVFSVTSKSEASFATNFRIESGASARRHR